jgi:hypothetical protein
MNTYYLYKSPAPRVQWELVRNPSTLHPLVFISSETASLEMTSLARSTGLDYMFYPFPSETGLPPATLHRNCGCGKRRR